MVDKAKMLCVFSKWEFVSGNIQLMTIRIQAKFKIIGLIFFYYKPQIDLAKEFFLL